MSALSNRIAEQYQDTYCSLQAIEEFIALLATKTTRYQYQEPTALVLKAKNNGRSKVNLNVYSFTNL